MSMLTENKMGESKQLPAIVDDLIYLAEEEEKLNRFKQFNVEETALPK